MTNQFAQMGFNQQMNAPRPAHDTHTINLVNLPLNPLELMTTMPPEINLPPNVSHARVPDQARLLSSKNPLTIPHAGLVLAIADSERRPVVPAVDPERHPDHQLASPKVQDPARVDPHPVPQPETR